MIHLFPKLKKRMIIICICYLVLVAFYIVLNPGMNPIVPLVIALVGLFVVMFSQYLNATNAHSQLLSKLYNNLDVDGFLKSYLPMLKLNLKNRNVYLTVRLHLSNAYCAQGRFDEAIELLSSLKVEDTKNHEDDLLSRFAIISNLCYCAEQKGDVENSKRYLADLLTLKRELEGLQVGKPEKKRMVFSTELNELILQYMTEGKTDIEALKNLSKNNSQKLHRVIISLWIARGYLAVNNRREAEKLLEQIIKVAPDLYPGHEAAALLSGLPAKEA